ncbi:MAG: hypothetical protein C0402_09875 [Thermodesulfovibrio sp.]|nr:hypothetical protein [Thermodesulfovibrio sp.]
MADDINSLSATTEREFIGVGEKLRSFAERFNENSESAAKIITVLDGGSGLNTKAFNDLFAGAYREIENCVQAISSGIADMNSLTSRMHDILSLRSFLKGLSHSISTLGMYIRIETARVDDADFNTMTAVVDDLGHQIVKETEEIAASGGEANAGLVTIVLRMNETMQELQRSMAEVQTSIDEILADVDSMMVQAGHVCLRMEGRTSQIMPEIGKVVGALQYHDISRQQMEHVSHALADISERSRQLDGMTDEEKDAFNQWVYNVITIQIHQLNQIVEEAGKAAAGISDHLTTVADLGEAQVDDVGMLIEEDGSDGHRIEHIGAEMESLSGILNQVQAVNRWMIDSMAGLSMNVGKMSVQVANIESISDSINLLALNAIIKVARTGEAGRGLGVLADEIRKLSDIAKNEIAKGARCITSILDDSARMKESISANLSRQIETTAAISTRTGDSVRKLLDADRDLMGSLSSISALSRTLQEDISELVSGITFHEVIGARMQSIVVQLQAMLDEAENKQIASKAGANGGTVSGASFDLHELSNRYTMESEREIHASAIAGGAGTAYELKPDKAGTGDSELGDNVELF